MHYRQTSAEHDHVLTLIAEHAVVLTLTSEHDNVLTLTAEHDDVVTLTTQPDHTYWLHLRLCRGEAQPPVMHRTIPWGGAPVTVMNNLIN